MARAGAHVAAGENPQPIPLSGSAGPCDARPPLAAGTGRDHIKAGPVGPADCSTAARARQRAEFGTFAIVSAAEQICGSKNATGRQMKTAKHHWWPRGLSTFWADETGGAHQLRPDGMVTPPCPPKSFGSIKNANAIHFEPVGTSPWDTEFELAYDAADTAFPHVAAWLQSLSSPVAASASPFEERLSPLSVEDGQRKIVGECLASLISRSPSFRSRVQCFVEDIRQGAGLPDTKADKTLIKMNVRRTQERFSREIGSRGKFAVLVSGEEEFIFGDGFFHNFSHAEPPSSPRCLVPITPNVAVFYVSPFACRHYPNAFVMNLRPDEVRFVNETVQVYSRNFVFFRRKRPAICGDFECGEHMQYPCDQHPYLEQLESVMAHAFLGQNEEP